MQKLNLSGLMPAIITPLKENGEIDYPGLEKNVKYYVNAGCTGIVVNGSTGEAVNLTSIERRQLIREISRIVPDGINVIAGTGTPTTKSTIELTEEAMQAGADAVLVITPYNAIPNAQGLLRHYSEVAEVGAPMILYNLPEHTGVTIGFKTIEALLKFDNVVGIKESSGDLIYFSELISQFGNHMSMLSGSDTLFFQCFLMGATGAILALGNIAPHMIIDILDAVRKNELEKARQLYFKLIPIGRSISDSINFPAPVKESVRLLGRPSGAPRSPILPVDVDEARSIRKNLVFAGLLKD
jgi:4-hydroxy-tetrahydrodipicolinate synthase